MRRIFFKPLIHLIRCFTIKYAYRPALFINYLIDDTAPYRNEVIYDSHSQSPK
jgi:hypothetical protein